MTEWVWRVTSPDWWEQRAAYIKEVQRIVQGKPCRWACGDNLRFPSNLDEAERVIAAEAFDQEHPLPAHVPANVLLVRRYERFIAQRE